MTNPSRPFHPAAALMLALPMLFGTVPTAQAQLSVGVGISLPGVSIGINLPAYPQLVRVPGYPVYYAPRAGNNYFFYDGLYWVFEDDNWYSSDWYNGPWVAVEPAYVPVYVLRVPVRYYSRPPQYFSNRRADAPPRWGDRWDRNAVPAPAPLPIYQRRYSGDRYPRAPEQQRELRNQNYRYQPRETVSRQQYQRPVAPATTSAPPPRDTRPDRADRRPDRADRPDRSVPPPPRDMQRPQTMDGPQARPQVQPPRPQVQPERPQVERPAGQPERPQGRPERVREQPVQAPPRPQPAQARPQPDQREPEQRGPGREAGQGNRGDGQDRGRGGPPDGKGRDKDK